MGALTIITNNVPRDVIDAWELSADEREEFDYLNWEKIEAGEDSASFVRYKGNVLDLGEFVRWDGVEFSPIREWDGYQSDSFFSGTLVRYVDDHCEQVVMGRFYS